MGGILKFYLLLAAIFYFSVNNLFAQTNNCTQSTIAVNYVVPANTTSIIPTNTMVAGVFFLCGPNSYLLDTASAFGCRDVLVNAGCKFVTNNSGCPAINYIYAKNSSTIVVKPGTQSQTYLIYEPGAVIIDQVGLSYTLVCTSISFPPANCGVTSINKNFDETKTVEIYPNPANDILNIELDSPNEEVFKIKIFNDLGQLKREEEIVFKEKTISIKTDNLKNGIYFVVLNSKTGSISKKFVVSH